MAYCEPTPERRELLDRNHKGLHDSRQWYQVFETLADARDRIRKQTGDKTFAHYDPEQLELLKEAASSLSRFVGIANNRMDEAKAEFDRTSELLHPKPAPRDLSDAAMAELGERMAADPSKVTSNTEGNAYIAHCHRETCAKVAKDGCCGGKPMGDGFCFDYAGKCPRNQEAEQCTAFAVNFVQWAENVHEQSGLAAVAARLSVPGSLLSGDSNYVGNCTSDGTATP